MHCNKIKVMYESCRKCGMSNPKGTQHSTINIACAANVDRLNESLIDASPVREKWQRL